MAISPITTPEQLVYRMSSIGRRLRRRANRPKRIQDRIDALQNELAAVLALKAKLDARDTHGMETDAAVAYAYLEPQWDDLAEGKAIHTDGGDIELTTRKTGKTVFPDGEAAAVEEIRARFPEHFDELVATTETVRKGVLKSQFPEILEVLSTVDAPGATTAYFKPHNTDHTLSRPVSFLRERAVKLGLLPAPDVVELATGSTTSPSAA